MRRKSRRKGRRIRSNRCSWIRRRRNINCRRENKKW